MSRPSVGPLELAVVALIALLAAAVWQHVLPKQEIMAQFVSVATFVITTFFLVTNYQNNVRSNSAKMVMDFASRIDSPEMRKYRAKLAKQLIEMRAHAKEAISNKETIRPKFVAEMGIANDAPFLDFLEDIGYFTKKGILDSDMVWNSLIWPVERATTLRSRRHTTFWRTCGKENIRNCMRGSSGCTARSFGSTAASDRGGPQPKGRNSLDRH